MPPKSTKQAPLPKSKKTTPVIQAAVVEQVQPVQAAPKSRSKKTPAAAPVQAPPVPVVAQAPAAPVEGAARVRRDVSFDTVEKSFEEILESLKSQMDEMRSNPQKRSVKYFRTLGKTIKMLRLDVKKVLTRTRKHKTPRNRTNPSGFMKPVKISTELVTFIGGDASREYSRNEVTKFICDYVKNNNLQDSKDKRNINCDAKLARLLNYDSKQGHITYPGIQKLIKHHFPVKQVPVAK